MYRVYVCITVLLLLLLRSWVTARGEEGGKIEKKREKKKGGKRDVERKKVRGEEVVGKIARRCQPNGGSN